MNLTSLQKRKILDHIDDVFHKIKARLLGRFFTGPRIYFQVVKQSDPFETIESLFRYTTHMLYGAGGKVDEHQIEGLAEVTGNYIDAKRLQTQNKIINAINSANTPMEALKAATDHLDKATGYMELLVSNESRISQSQAEQAGINQVASSLGVEDPVIVKFGVVDGKLCENCRILWHDPSNPRKPRPYKMSELADGYMTDHKNPYATSGPSHPRCRHVTSFVPPNFSFDESGQIVWKAFGHSYYDEFYGKGKKGGSDT